jgi:hypothetical protein
VCVADASRDHVIRAAEFKPWVMPFHEDAWAVSGTWTSMLLTRASSRSSDVWWRKDDSALVDRRWFCHHPSARKRHDGGCRHRERE